MRFYWSRKKKKKKKKRRFGYFILVSTLPHSVIILLLTDTWADCIYDDWRGNILKCVGSYIHFVDVIHSDLSFSLCLIFAFMMQCWFELWNSLCFSISSYMRVPFVVALFSSKLLNGRCSFARLWRCCLILYAYQRSEWPV